MQIQNYVGVISPGNLPLLIKFYKISMEFQKQIPEKIKEQSLEIGNEEGRDRIFNGYQKNDSMRLLRAFERDVLNQLLLT